LLRDARIRCGKYSSKIENLLTDAMYMRPFLNHDFFGFLGHVRLDSEWVVLER
jgi:hypothetical protein